MLDNLKRCGWVSMDDPLYREYHDKEWGVPLHRDPGLFELLVLEGFQAGLSWGTILKKRANFRRAFDGFNPAEVAQYGGDKVRELKNDAGIVRNELKIRSAVDNAKTFLRVQGEFGSFETYVWRFVGGEPRVNRWRTLHDIPARTKQSDALSSDLVRRGFRFVGSTICYAYMQATGMVNDHVVSCFRYKELLGD
jgi:DNA-3-methyladenine glycosylase I